MEPSQAIKLCNAAAEQFFLDKSASSIEKFEKQLNALLSLSEDATNLMNEFHLKSLPATKCVSNFTMVLLDSGAPQSIVEKVLSVLNNLLSIPSLHNSLKTTFNLTSVLAATIQIWSTNRSSTVTFKCLQLLNQTTYGISTCQFDDCLQNLVEFLINNIKKTSDQSREVNILLICVLANLCRKSSAIVTYIQKKENVVSFFRHLLSIMSTNDDPLLKVTTFSCFASLTFNDEIGSMFFHDSSMFKTLELIFNYIQRDDPTIKCYSVDILIDWINSGKIKNHLIQHRYLKANLTKFVESISTQTSSKSAAKAYELLHTMCSIRALNGIIIPLFFSNASENRPMCESPISVALYWFSQKLDGLYNAPILASLFLIALFNDDFTLPDLNLERQADDIINTVLKDIQVCLHNYDVDFEVVCNKCSADIIILENLCKYKDCMQKLSNSMDVDCLIELLEIIYDNLGVSDSTSVLGQHFGAFAVEAVINCLSLMATLKGTVKGMEEQTYKFLQDARSMPILAASLSSQSSEYLQKTFRLLGPAVKHSNFPFIKFTDCLASINDFRALAHTSPKPFGLETNRDCKLPVMCSNRLSSTEMPAQKSHTITNGDINIDVLITKIQRSVGLADVTISEIIEVFEHNLSIVKLEKKQIEDLLDAKTIALKQADHCIAQYRSSWVHSDAEISQLRKLLHESEKRGEAAKQEMTKVGTEKQQLELKLQSMKSDVTQLDQQLDDEREKLQEARRTISNFQEEINRELVRNKAVDDINKVLEQEKDACKKKLEELTADISKLKSDKKKYSKLLKDSNTDLESTEKEKKVLEEKLAKVATEILNLKEHMENENKAFNDQISSLKSELMKAQSDYEACNNQLEQLLEIGEKFQSFSGRLYKGNKP